MQAHTFIQGPRKEEAMQQARAGLRRTMEGSLADTRDAAYPVGSCCWVF